MSHRYCLTSLMISSSKSLHHREGSMLSQPLLIDSHLYQCSSAYEQRVLFRVTRASTVNAIMPHHLYWITMFIQSRKACSKEQVRFSALMLPKHHQFNKRPSCSFIAVLPPH